MNIRKIIVKNENKFLKHHGVHSLTTDLFPVCYTQNFTVMRTLENVR